MARGPFQGSWQPNLRPVVVTAPDALVYINGAMELAGCPGCSRTFDINKYITSIQVDLNIDSVPGSASLSLSVPRQTIDDFLFNGNPVITPMMEVEIYAKGYYLLEGIPQYYPIFWGLVTEVNDQYSGGAHTVSINCADILKWWELCKVNVHAGLTTPGAKSKDMLQNIFHGMNPFDIIFTLAQKAFGDVVYGANSLTTSGRQTVPQVTFDVALSDMALYWQDRFARIRNGLMLYGTNGIAVRGDTLESTYQQTGGPGGYRPNNWVSNAVRYGNGGQDQGQMGYDPTDPGVVAFRDTYSNLSIDMWQSEYQTKLELAQAAKEVIGYEFFMDVDGSIVFKPPFYNLNVLPNFPLSWIQDIDVIEWDFSESEAEVVTQIILQGSFAGSKDIGTGQEFNPFSSVVDYHLLRKYGWRSQTYNSEFLGNEMLMFYHGLDLLDRLNSRRHRGTVTIPMRPELRLGFPVYIASKDQIWYVQGISHNLNFGGRATTTLTLTAKRAKFIGINGITTLKLMSMTSGPAPATAAPVTTPGASATGPGNSQSAGNPLPSTAFPYSSRQLSAQAKFQISLGTHPAYLPPINTDVSAVAPDGVNPYEANVMQDPTTGLLVGAPSVVMVYTGSFAGAASVPSNLNSNLGQQNPGQNPMISPTLATQVTATQNTNQTNRSTGQLDQRAEQLREQYITNRYAYGLNSAGRFIYAYDKGGLGSANPSGVIGEILTMPSANCPPDPATQPSGSLFAGSPVALIRPVSDECGYEVIGHYKYGRRVALSDGSLVLTGNTNSAVNIDTQFALGGNLFATLTAQTQGLTTISASAYPNPATAVTQMAPTSLASSGSVTQPDSSAQTPNPTGNQLVGPSGYNALGGPQQVGSPPSVQATQLSSALTLAEMDVQEQGQDPGDPNDVTCPCQLMRIDLAFLNVGYTVSGPGGVGSTIIGSATPDATSLGNSVPGAPVTATLGSSQNPSPLQQSLNNQIQQVQNLQTQLDAVQSRANQIDQVTNPVGWAAAQQTIQQLQNEIDAATATQTDIEQQIQTNASAPNQAGSSGTVPAPTAGSVLAKAEQFLVNLYQALDSPHQQLEQTFRGNYLPGGALNQPANSLNGGASSSAPPLAPPFSPATASALGNPAAIAIAGDSAVNDLSQTWSQFGTQLAAAAQRTQLQQQVASGLAQLSAVQSQISALQQQASATGSSTVGAGGQTLQQQIAALQTQASMLQQQISNAQQQVATLPAPTSTGTPSLTPVTP